MCAPETLRVQLESTIVGRSYIGEIEVKDALHASERSMTHATAVVHTVDTLDGTAFCCQHADEATKCNKAPDMDLLDAGLVLYPDLLGRRGRLAGRASCDCTTNAAPHLCSRTDDYSYSQNQFGIRRQANLYYVVTLPAVRVQRGLR